MSTSTNYWTLNANNEPEGPVSLQGLRLALDDGGLTQDSLVCEEGGSEWFPVATLFQDPPKQSSRGAGASIWRRPLLYGLSGFAAGVAFTMVGLALFAATLPDGPSGSSDGVKWFNVRGPAENPRGTYYGWLCEKGSRSGPSVIVDFGRPMQLATEDLIEAKFTRTERTGKWMDGDYRIYVPDGEVRPVDSSRTQ